MMVASRLVDSQGQPVRLAGQIARGGEGAIHLVDGQPDIVAKVYHHPPDAEKARKLAAMARVRTDRLAAPAAWPTMLLHERQGGPMVGLLMPRVHDHKPVHELYSPRSRLIEFPEATWPFLLHAAANIARAIEVVHTHGHVIGDINHSSVLISRQATVRLIDCDSFQVAADGKCYHCMVGVSEFTPPELHGQPLRGVTRTPNHDAFGLAVLLFHLLFMGRHPFAGRHSGPGDMPLPRAIAEGRFAYGRQAVLFQMRPPPGTLPLEGASMPVATLFERAFAPAAKRSGRTAPMEWVEALTTLSGNLRPCGQNASHHFLRDLPACPWCAIEASSGVFLFPVAAQVTRQPDGSFTLETIWAALVAVASPGPAPALPATASVGARPDPALIGARQGITRRRKIILTITVALCVTSIAISPAYGLWLGLLIGFIGWSLGRNLGAGEATSVRKALDEARARWTAAVRNWEATTGEAAFLAKRQALDAARSSYLGLESERQRRIHEARSHARERQLQRHLERNRLRGASIRNVGPGRKATLLSYGIETAADVTHAAIMSVPGFGPGLTSQLIAWRQDVEARFRFEPARGLDPADLATIDREIDHRRQALAHALTAGSAELQSLRQRILDSRIHLQPAIDDALRALAQAEANAGVVGKI